MQSISRSFFDSLPEEIKSDLLSRGVTEKRGKGSLIFGELDNVEDIFFLLEGYAALYRSSFRGENRVIFICSAGEVLNEVGMDSSKTSIAAKALSELVLLRVPRETLFQLMQQDFRLAQAMFHALARKTRRLYHKVGNDNGTYTLKNRLAAMVWKLARDYGVEDEAGRRIDFEITVNLLSEMLGAKRESVSRALSELKKSGLITHENGTLTVRNMQQLKEAVLK